MPPSKLHLPILPHWGLSFQHMFLWGHCQTSEESVSFVNWDQKILKGKTLMCLRASATKVPSNNHNHTSYPSFYTQGSWPTDRIYHMERCSHSFSIRTYTQTHTSVQCTYTCILWSLPVIYQLALVGNSQQISKAVSVSVNDWQVPNKLMGRPTLYVGDINQ